MPIWGAAKPSVFVFFSIKLSLKACLRLEMFYNVVLERGNVIG